MGKGERRESSEICTGVIWSRTRRVGYTLKRRQWQKKFPVLDQNRHTGLFQTSNSYKWQNKNRILFLFWGGSLGLHMLARKSQQERKPTSNFLMKTNPIDPLGYSSLIRTLRAKKSEWSEKQKKMQQKIYTCMSCSIIASLTWKIVHPIRMGRTVIPNKAIHWWAGGWLRFTNRHNF